MSSESTVKNGAETAPGRDSRGRFAPGGPGGPGRPRRGQSLADQWRRATDWEAIRARLEGIVLDPKAKHADIVAAAKELTDRAWGKPLASHDVSVSAALPDASRDVSALSLEERREWLAKLRSLPMLGEGGTDAGDVPAPLPAIPTTSSKAL